MTFRHEKRIPPVIWAVVADRSRARILSAAWPEGTEWEERQSLVHAEGNQKPGEVQSDRQGAFFSSHSSNQSAGEDATDFRHLSAEHFASEIVDLLEASRVKNEFGKLAFIAPPLFLGSLRKCLPASLQQMVVFDLHKDYTHNSVKDVAAVLSRELASAASK